MRKHMRKILSAVLVSLMLVSLCPMALAAEIQPPVNADAENSITFSGLNQLDPGESVKYEINGADGTEITVGIERVEAPARASGRTWRVWYAWLTNNVEFYMTVANNKVTSVYDYSISLFGSSYEDANLTKTSTYGKLTFTHKALGGLSASTCWLKGTVTGEDDQIEVSWQM